MIYDVGMYLLEGRTLCVKQVIRHKGGFVFTSKPSVPKMRQNIPHVRGIQKQTEGMRVADSLNHG